jgi:Site-specific recombinase XerD
MEIQKVIERANRLLTEARYTNSRIYTYNWLWKKGILSYMNAKSLVDFDEKVGKSCMLSFHDGGTVTFCHRDLIKSIDVLINVFLNDNLGKRIRTSVQYPFRGEIGSAAEDYFESLKARGVSERKTIQNYKRIISNFVEYLLEHEISSISGIIEDCIVKFIESRQYRQKEYIETVRRFLNYLYKEHLIANDYSCVLRSLGKNVKHVKMPSFYSPGEIRQLEESISRTSNVGKRDYAMVTLCSRLGLRVSDVANLSFKDINWDNNSINIIQYKTGNPLTLPLLPVVGNAIIDYLKNARPKSISSNIFLSCRPPYGEMNPGSVHGAIAVAFRESGVDFGDRHHGGHALRFSLAQRMLDKSIPIPVISEILGHAEVDTTRTYIRIDLVHMMRCVLNIPETNDAFYTQRGGWFYDRSV